MGAWESNGYGKVVDPFWDNKEKSSGGGSDIPDPTGQENYQVIGTRNGAYQLFEPNSLVRSVPNSTDEEDVGKVLTKYGTGTNQYGWLKAQASYTDYSNTSSGLSANTVQGAIDELASNSGGSETVLFDGDVEVVSGQTGYFVREIPLADRIELCQGVHSKYNTLTIEASYVKSRPEDEKTETVNISRSFDLEKLLIGDAQTYNDPQYDTDNTAHVILRNEDLVEVFSGERYLQTTIQINQNGTDPENDVYTGKLFRITFSYFTFNNGSSEYLDLPKEQKVRTKITVK